MRSNALLQWLSMLVNSPAYGDASSQSDRVRNRRASSDGFCADMVHLLRDMELLIL